jgi:hypothetical protein
MGPLEEASFEGESEEIETPTAAKLLSAPNVWEPERRELARPASVPAVIKVVKPVRSPAKSQIGQVRSPVPLFVDHFLGPNVSAAGHFPGLAPILEELGTFHVKNGCRHFAIIDRHSPSRFGILRHASQTLHEFELTLPAEPSSSSDQSPYTLALMCQFQYSLFVSECRLTSAVELFMQEADAL